jgi:(p)ppGpp synthase/HD superfamily hydrolase
VARTGEERPGAEAGREAPTEGPGPIEAADLRHRAWLYAAEKHQGQIYPGTGLPYLAHVGAVVLALLPGLQAEPLMRADLAILCAILHDTIEDAGATAEELSRLFGSEVAEGVSALSKNPALKGPEAMLDSLRRIRQRPPEIWLVKLADRAANLSIPAAGWTAERRRQYALEGELIDRELGLASPALSAILRSRVREWLAPPSAS